MITEQQQKLYDLARAEMLLKKHDIFDKNQETKIKKEKNKLTVKEK
jgi:hypothetical protein